MRHWLKNWLPDRAALHRLAVSQRFSTWSFHHSYLWHLNRQSASRGIASGLLVAFIPLPLQMLSAAFVAFLVRGNLPIAIVVTWISNPITFVPFNYLIYKTGVFLTQANSPNGMPEIHKLEFHMESLALIWNELIQWINSLGQAYLVGLVVISLSAAIIGYCLTYVVWVIYVKVKWLKRKNRTR